MKLFAFVNQGLEEISKTEIEELVNSKVIVNNSVLEFELENKNDIIKLAYRSQSLRRLVLSLGKFSAIEDVYFNFTDLFYEKCSFKVEVENVKGQENRLNIARNVAGKIFDELEKKNIPAEIDLKKPDLLINIFFNGENYFLGMDLCGIELNSRDYRVFPHSASFKGDLGYFFVRKSGFKKGNKLLVGFTKDGVIPIEAALYANDLSIRKNNNFSLFKLNLFKDCKYDSHSKNENKIYAFDEVMPNIISARKNSQLAKVKELIDLRKISLEELDVKFSENEFDNLIFHVTTKDEDKINEIYYQANYILKQKGTLLLIGRKGWELSISDKFKLMFEEEIKRGESVNKIWLLELK